MKRRGSRRRRDEEMKPLSGGGRQGGKEGGSEGGRGRERCRGEES